MARERGARAFMRQGFETFPQLTGRIRRSASIDASRPDGSRLDADRGESTAKRIGKTDPVTDHVPRTGKPRT